MALETGRRILVTGANGFIGRALVRHLHASGYVVRAAARQKASVSFGSGVETVTLPDLAEPLDWSSLLNRVDAVVHLAGVAHRGGGENSNYDQIIRAATDRLAGACAALPIDRLIFVSSIGAQAGSAADLVITEESPLRPVSAYDRAKLDAEDAVRGSGCAYTILRPVLVYGPGVKGNMGHLIKIAMSPWPLPLGGLHSMRSLLSLDNFVDAIRFCLSSERARDQTFVLADEDPISVADLIGSIRQLAGRSPGLFRVPSIALKLLSNFVNPGLWDRIGRDLVVDSSKLVAAGWRPPSDIRKGLSDLILLSKR